MNDDELDERMLEIGRGYNAPPPVPREEIWAAIQARREEARALPGAGRWGEGRQRVWLGWGIGIAATLLFGVGLGRLSVEDPASGPLAGAPAVVVSEPSPAVATSGATAYRVATEQHLGQAQLLLTSFRTEARGGQVDERVADWAKELLSTTRLLLDSPAAEDEALRGLLEDLELVLAQLSQLPAARTSGAGQEEVEMVREAIEQGGVLPKLQSAIETAAPANTDERL